MAVLKPEASFDTGLDDMNPNSTLSLFGDPDQTLGLYRVPDRTLGIYIDPGPTLIL